MASIRLRTRRDGTFYTAVLYVLNGKQTSSSFNDHAEALRFQELATGPARPRPLRCGQSKRRVSMASLWPVGALTMWTT
jgi:hypothetical protein